MDRNGMTRSEMIEWLVNAISAEVEKPFEEIDYDFVDKCGSLLDELDERDYSITKEEAAERVARLKSESNARRRKALKSRRRLIRVLVAAAVVVCMSVTVLAVPKLQTMLLRVFELDVGESITNGDVTYINEGEISSYSSIDELISQNNLDVLYFGDLPDGITISSVVYIENSDTTIITFNDPTINFSINHNNSSVTDSVKNRSEKYTTELFDAYLFQIEQNGSIEYYSYFCYHNCLYIINCKSETTLMTILNQLKEGE